MKFRFTISPEGEVIYAGSRAWVNSRLKELPKDEEYVMDIKKYYKPRSLKQNRYYWGVVVSLVFAGLKAAGFDDVRDEMDAHDVIKAMFFRKVIHSEKHDNLVMEKSTAAVSTAEFEDKMEQIRQWAFIYLGVTIPLPNTQAALDLE